MPDDRFKRYQEAGNDFLETARARAEDFLRELAKATESTQKQASGQVEDLVAAGRKGTDQMIDLIRREVASQLEQLGIKRESSERTGRKTAPEKKSAPAKKVAPAKKTAPAKTTAAKKTGAAKKTAAKKAPAKKAPAKKAPAKKASGSTSSATGAANGGTGSGS